MDIFSRFDIWDPDPRRATDVLFHPLSANAHDCACDRHAKLAQRMEAKANCNRPGVTGILIPRYVRTSKQTYCLNIPLEVSV